MLKKRVLKRLLPLLFSFCCVFSGFLNVNASAASLVIDETAAYHFISRAYLAIYRGAYFNDFGIGTGQGSGLYSIETTATVDEPYYLKNDRLSNVSYLNATFFGRESYPIFEDKFDYYLYCHWEFDSICTFNPDRFIICYRPDNTNVLHDYDDVTVIPHMSQDEKGFSFYTKVDFTQDASIQSVIVGDSSLSATVGANGKFWALIVPFEKDASEEQVNSIITAINNQTGTLGGKLDDIDSSVDDVQQSIEDQYSGEPEEEFNIDDVITEHTEKMGVLSFGSDVMLQFLDMFQSANVGTAELTFPGFNITVENVEYAVWPDYSFNFEQLNEWVPALMSVIRVMLPAFVWLMVLRYCIKVFEDNFLAK